MLLTQSMFENLKKKKKECHMNAICYQLPNSSNPSLVTYSLLFSQNYFFPHLNLHKTSHMNVRLSLDVSPQRTWVLGITELMRGCTGPKY